MNRKGTEKPIEIFVALFIILAVALVMLKLFQGQIAEKQKELAGVQQEQQAQELKNKLQLSCSQKCTEASNAACSLASLASLCAYNSQNFLPEGSYADLNNNKVKDADITLLAGIAVCEERVYCFHVMDSCCNQRISPASCKTILTDYWTQQGFSSEEISTMLNTASKTSVLYAGACTAPTGYKRWDKLDSWTSG